MTFTSIGSYRVVRLLGTGGMGEVYEARSPSAPHAGQGLPTLPCDTVVAVKVFSVADAKARFLRERFVAEGQLLTKLRHPHLVRVHACGIDEPTGRPYYVMDCVRDRDGGSTTLHDVTARGKVTEARAERWYGDLCDVVSYCHSQGIVHRDIKLGNVLLDAEDHAVLSDFGVSRIVEPDLREALKLATTFVTGETTGTRPVMGSYWYLAPEVRRGEAATFASDWYALGVLFFRLLTGMWYEPGTDALELLAPYDPIWRKRLEALLDEDPVKRIAALEVMAEPSEEGTSPVGLAPRASRRLVVVSLLSVAICLGLSVWLRSGGGVSVRRQQGARTAAVSSKPPYRLSKPVFAPNRPFSFAFDATNRFAFCPCPPGTNGYRKLSIAVTHSYWLGATPVTRRQYFAVTGKPLTAWEGGEDAPMTYLSREEMTNFCALLNRRFADALPPGYEIRLPTMAEWRLAYRQGNTVPTTFPDGKAMRRAYAERGWFGQGFNGEPKNADMRRYYVQLNRPIPLVTNIWTDFPPRIINPGKENWMRASSQFPPVPVGLKPANRLGLYDMLGNCCERVYDTCSSNCYHWGHTEWGVTTIGLYGGRGLSLTNPVERTGALPLMVGTYLAPDLPGDRVWSADFDRLPHLGFRLCLGPKIPQTGHP